MNVGLAVAVSGSKNVDWRSRLGGTSHSTTCTHRSVELAESLQVGKSAWQPTFAAAALFKQRARSPAAVADRASFLRVQGARAAIAQWQSGRLQLCSYRQVTGSNPVRCSLSFCHCGQLFELPAWPSLSVRLLSVRLPDRQTLWPRSADTAGPAKAEEPHHTLCKSLHKWPAGLAAVPTEAGWPSACSVNALEIRSCRGLRRKQALVV